MVTTALIFDHRGRTPKGKEGTIEIRITIDRKPRYISTGIKVLKNHFQYGLVVDRYDCDELNERLQIMKKKVESEINRCLKNNESFDLSSFKKEMITISTEQEIDLSFIDWVYNQIPLLSVSEETRKHYMTLYAVLVEFGKMLSWADVKVENLFLFDSWLHQRRKKQTKAQMEQNIEADFIDGSTIYNYHKHLKALLKRAYQMDKISSVPYDKLKGRIKRYDKENVEYLTEEQMKKLLEMTPVIGSNIDLAKDLFIIQMFTGLGYSDMQKLNLDNYKLVNGKWINNGERIKTGVPYVSQLLPQVVRVLEKYNWKVPKLYLQTYNETLKIIGEALGFGVNMHSHLARHTFATYMLKNGVKIENLSKMLGHTNIKQTQRYAKVLASSVHEDFDMIEQKINNL